MLSKSFKSGKCKTSLKLASSRIKLLKNKRDIQVKHLRREVAQLLATGQEQTARIRVEHVIREEKTMSGYDLIELYCELIVARLPIIESQKSCPIDLKEAISSLIFASPRCADIPELVDARKHFVAKYGKEFATSALELRPGCGVNHMIVEKLSAQAPDTETKIKTLTAIAKEHDVKWDSKAFEELQKPAEDLLNGSSSFTRANRMPMEYSNDKFSPVASQKQAASENFQHEIASKPSSSNSTSHANLRTSDSKARDSFPSQGTTSLNAPTWTMEFKDAVSAAQVAAESAERASMAARAAAELAGRGNISRQNSNEPNRSAILKSGRNAMPNRVPSSKLKQDDSESVNTDYNRAKGFLGVEEEPDKLPRDELRGTFSHDNDDDMEFSSQVNNVEKIDGFRQSFSRAEFLGSQKKHDEAVYTEEDADVKYDNSASTRYISTLDDSTIFAPSVGKRQSDYTYEIGDYKRDALGDYAAPVFDDYDPEPNHSKGSFLDSFDNEKDEEVFDIAPSSSGVNSIFFNDSIHENHNVAVENVPSSEHVDSRTVTYDDSASEDEDDIRRSLKNGIVKNSRLLHEESGFSHDLGSREELQPSTSSKAKPEVEMEEKGQHQVPPSVVTKDSELASEGGLDLKFGRLTGGLRNRGYNYPPYTASSVVDPSLASKEMTGSATSSTEHNISQLEKSSTSTVIPDEDMHAQESSWKAPSKPESGKAKGSGLEEHAEISRTNKTLTRDKSVEDASSFSTSRFSYGRENNQGYRGGEPNRVNQDPYDSSITNTFETTGSEATDQKVVDENPRTKAYKKLSTRMSGTDLVSDGYNGERDSQINIGSRGNTNANPIANPNTKLSRRTRAFYTNDKNNAPRSKGHSNTPSNDSDGQPISQVVDEATISQGNQNLTSQKPNLSAGLPGEKTNTKNIEARSNPDISASGSGNNKVSSDSRGTESSKASHVHPKLPDYDTLAAHFQSLRSNYH